MPLPMPSQPLHFACTGELWSCKPSRQNNLLLKRGWSHASLAACSFLTPTLMGGVSFGAGLGITLFGIMYMFIHDGMVHRRFPVSAMTAHASTVVL